MHLKGYVTISQFIKHIYSSTGPCITLEQLKKYKNGNKVKITRIESDKMAFDIPTDSQVDTPSNIQILTNKIYYKAQKSVSVHYITTDGQTQNILLNHLKQVRYTSLI